MVLLTGANFRRQFATKTHRDPRGNGPESDDRTKGGGRGQ